MGIYVFMQQKQCFSEPQMQFDFINGHFEVEKLFFAYHIERPGLAIRKKKSQDLVDLAHI